MGGGVVYYYIYERLKFNQTTNWRWFVLRKNIPPKSYQFLDQILILFKSSQWAMAIGPPTNG